MGLSHHNSAVDTIDESALDVPHPDHQTRFMSGWCTLGFDLDTNILLRRKVNAPQPCSLQLLQLLMS